MTKEEFDQNVADLIQGGQELGAKIVAESSLNRLKQDIDVMEITAMLDEAKKHTDKNGIISGWGYRMPFK